MADLTLCEAKSTAFVAYDGLAGESWRFSDGNVWFVSAHWLTRMTGFKAVKMQGNGKSVIAFAGTDSAMDVAVDISQVLGGRPPQYWQALSIVYSERRSESFMLSGHSLGGGLAAFCSVDTKLRTATVNPAPLVGAASWRAFGRNDQITNYVASGGEVVSSSPGRNPGRDVTISARGNFFTRHSLANIALEFPLPTKQ